MTFLKYMIGRLEDGPKSLVQKLFAWREGGDFMFPCNIYAKGTMLIKQQGFFTLSNYNPTLPSIKL